MNVSLRTIATSIDNHIGATLFGQRFSNGILTPYGLSDGKINRGDLVKAQEKPELLLQRMGSPADLTLGDLERKLYQLEKEFDGQNKFEIEVDSVPQY